MTSSVEGQGVSGLSDFRQSKVLLRERQVGRAANREGCCGPVELYIGQAAFVTRGAARIVLDRQD